MSLVDPNDDDSLLGVGVGVFEMRDDVGVKGRTQRNGGVSPIVAYAVAGILGGSVGLWFGANAFRQDITNKIDEAGTVFGPLLTIPVAVIAGVLVAWFLTSAVVSWAPGQVHCPRCGSTNPRSADRCASCDLRFQ